MAKSAPKRLVILDTHAILHRAYHALPDFSSSRGEPTGALYGLISMLVKIVSDLKPDYVAACYDLPGGTFRSAAYEQYKATRAAAEDDLVHQIKRARDVLGAFGIPKYEAVGFEADDCIGTIVEQVKNKKNLEVIIASGDMDTLQLIEGERVRVFTLRKGLTDTVMFDENAVEGRYGFGPEVVPDLKGIAGDPSDNIKGVPGVGEGSALKLLKTYGNMAKLYAALKKEGVEKVAQKSDVQKRFAQLVADHKEDAEFSRGLATIRRDAPIEFMLPERGWREGVETQKLFDLMAELDFRSLMPRVKALFGEKAEAEFAAPEISDSVQTPPPPDFKEVELAVWVLDSNVTEPQVDDILRMGGSQNWDVAKKNILEKIKKDGLSFVYDDIELPLSPVLRAMERRGVKINRPYLKELGEEYHKELDAIAARIYKHAGGEFNINSPRQLGEVLFDKLGLINKKKTAAGARSTRESELTKLRESHPIVGEVLAYRELSKLLGTYIDTIPTLLDQEDRLHTTFIQTGTSTGRLGSENPNVQNIPIKSDLGRRIRHAFEASEGYELVSFDYSQIELRIAAMISGDKGLSEVFASGRDAHAEVASRVFGVEAGQVTPGQRRIAKTINFGILYGMGVSSLQQSLGTKRAEAQEFYDHYFTAFPKLADYMDETKAFASRHGYTQTLFGRRRYFAGIRSPIPYVRASAERMAINAPVQGSQADLIKLAMVQLARYFIKDGLEQDVHMLLQVHDELVFEIKKSKVAAVAPKIKEIMESAMPHDKSRGVPVVVEGKRGPNWGQMNKLEQKL